MYELEKPVGAVDTKSDKLSEDEKKKINEDRINETKQKYYKLMGVDSPNREIPGIEGHY